jgi:YfiH family protein
MSDEAVVVTEEAIPGDVPLFTNPAWRDRFPWAFQATTGRGSQEEPFDLSFFGEAATGTILNRWRRVRQATGFYSVAHGQQVHGCHVRVHERLARAIVIADETDGHVTRAEGVLLAVSIADCVPIFLLHERSQTIGLLHAGWRGVAAGVLEEGIDVLLNAARGGAESIYCHFGPAICGKCYEVGPEVFSALGLRAPEGNQPIDLRAVLGDRAARAGVSAKKISTSTLCTKCDADRFFSHRGGARERQMALLGLRSIR